VKQLACWVAIAALLGCTAAHAYPNRPDGPVLDLADIFPTADETALNQRLTDYWASSGNAVVVVSVESLDGQPIEEYATGLFNEWGIGDSKTDRGLLVLVAPNERKVRIEVGCGLEGTISDALASRVIQSKMIPEYRNGQLEEGTMGGVDALIEYLRSPAAANDNGPHTQACRARMKGKAA
jgi:uncharacterized protein